MSTFDTETDDLKTTILILYVVETLEGLRKRGMIEGGVVPSAKTSEFVAWLKSRGFRPTNEEITDTLGAINGSMDASALATRGGKGVESGRD